MNINIGLKSVAVKGTTAATVRTPLLYILCICPLHIISFWQCYSACQSEFMLHALTIVLPLLFPL